MQKQNLHPEPSGIDPSVRRILQKFAGQPQASFAILQPPISGSKIEKPNVVFPSFSQKTPGQDGDLRFCRCCKMELRRSVYYHHARQIREHGGCDQFTPRRFICPECPTKIGTLEKLCMHLHQRHGAPTQIKTAVFDDESSFQKFRVELEGKGGNFRMARGNKRNKNGTVKYFRCNRTRGKPAGKKDTNEANEETSKDENDENVSIIELPERPFGVKQTLRTEKSCTAFFNQVLHDNGKIEVRYCDFHLHDDVRIRIPEPARKRIIEMSLKGLPLAVILLTIKKEIPQLAEPGSANERRLFDIRAGDIRQTISAYSRHMRTKSKSSTNAEAAESPKGNSTLSPVEAPETKLDMKEQTEDEKKKCRKGAELTETEKEAQAEFDSNGAKILAEIHQRQKRDIRKRILFETLRNQVIFIQQFLKKANLKERPAQDENDLLGMAKKIGELCKMLYRKGGEEVMQQEKVKVSDEQDLPPMLADPSVQIVSSDDIPVAGFDVVVVTTPTPTAARANEHLTTSMSSDNHNVTVKRERDANRTARKRPAENELSKVCQSDATVLNAKRSAENPSRSKDDDQTRSSTILPKRVKREATVKFPVCRIEAPSLTAPESVLSQLGQQKAMFPVRRLRVSSPIRPKHTFLC